MYDLITYFNNFIDCLTLSRRLRLLLKGVALNFNQINNYQLLKDLIV